jgi:intraflagellar transport protein 88
MSTYIVTAAKLVAPRINPGDPDAGFQWCMDELGRAKLPHFVDDVLMAKSAHCLAVSEVDKAIEVLKLFEKHSGASRTKAAANLSFLYLLEGNIAESERYAMLATEQDEFHVQVCGPINDLDAAQLQAYLLPVCL